MPTKFRIGSFNTENLFRRAKVFTRKDPAVGDSILKTIGDLQNELDQPVYDKAKILGLYNEVKGYVSIREDRGKFWKGQGQTAIQANGREDWDGSLEFKKADFTEIIRSNTAQVIRDVDANLMCLVEVEDKPTLAAFNSQLLESRYKYNMLIDCISDPRGIDVGLYSDLSLGAVWTHMYDMKGSKRIFSRDCLEVQVFLPGGKPLYILCNHFKSRGYGATLTNDAKRTLQAQRVAEIVESKYNLDQDFVAVAGDFNDTADSGALHPLLALTGLRDVLGMQFPTDPDKRWTYHYKKNEQIDFILVSRPLQEAFDKAGVARGGIYNLATYSNGQEQSFDTVTSTVNEASDHGAVWADFNIAD